MSQGRTIDPELEAELAEIAERAGCELAHVAFAGSTLRLVLDRPEGGVTIDDCATVSRQVSAFLDALDFGPGKYVLEVSSPGLDRELYRPGDYERFTGRRARVTWFDPDSGRKQTSVGVLDAFDPSSGGRVKLTPDGAESACIIPLPQIETARLEIEI